MTISKQVAANKRSTVMIMLVFVVFVSLIGGLFAWLSGSWSMVFWFLGIAAVYALIQYFVAGKLSVVMTGAREIQKSDNPRFYGIVEELSETAKLPMPKVYVIKDTAPNAFATGRDPAHAIVAATTGLIEIMDDKELRSVMAHEMSHVKNYDIRVGMIVFGLVCVIGFISDIGLRMLFYSNRDDDNKSPIGLVIAVLTLILAPIAAALAQMAVSRQREYLADSSSAQMTKQPESMISALKKLDAHARPMHQQNPATEALFIANPLKKTFFSNIFSTHPSIDQRVERLSDARK
ncbi:MAG: M48 family metalloprotease [Candidatus Nomurabacteria bacterium]|jgi:heat shock protein HtpX|nr:M48 family metalloprotease [Candidatus Nomurabacteria bacterium]